MKKLLFALLLCTITARLAAQQSQPLVTPDSLPTVRAWGGYLAGIQAAEVDPVTQQITARPHFGFFIRWKITDRFRLNLEMMFKWAGRYPFQSAYSDSTFNHPEHKIDIDIPYLGFWEFPVNVQYNLPGDRFSVHAGARYSRIMPFDNTQYNFYETGNPAHYQSVPASKAVRKMDIGLHAGVEWRVAPRTMISLRYNYGLYDLSKNNFFKNNTIHRNSDIQLSVKRYFLIENK